MMLKRLLAGALVCALVFGAVACNKNAGEQPKKEVSAVTVKDSQGREIKVPEKIEKVIVLNGNCYTMLRVLGVDDTVVGCADTMKEAIANGAQVFGSWKEPNVEKIIEAKPDVVFGYGKYMKPESAKQIEDAGITLIFLEFYVAKDIPAEITSLGKIYKKEARAKEYLDFLDKYNNLIKDRVKDIKEEDKVKVYWENYTDYGTVAKGSGGHDIVELAGCINIAGNEKGEFPKINDEWVVEKNPQVIVKNTSSTKGILGLDVPNDSKAKEYYESMLKRPGWSNIDAVKNKKVIEIASEIGTSPEGSIIGTLALAKVAYPDKFKDVEPLEVYKEMQSKFFNNNNLKGIYLYPWENK